MDEAPSAALPRRTPGRSALLARMGQCWELVAPDLRARWLALLPLAVLAAAFEAVGAGAVFTLLAALTQPEALLQTPALAATLGRLGFVDPPAALAALVAALAGFYLLRGAVMALAGYLRHRCVEETAARTSATMLAGYLRAPFAFHRGRDSAELIQNADLAVRRLYLTVMAPALGVATELLVILGLAVLLVVASPLAALAAGSGLAAVAWLLLRATRRAQRRLGDELESRASGALRHLQQALGGLREIKVRGREEFFAERFAHEQREMARSRYVHATLADLPRHLIETTFFVSTLVLLLFVVDSDGAGGASLPLLGLYAYTGFRVVPSANRITWQLSNIRFGAAAIDRVHADWRALTRQGITSGDEACTFSDRVALRGVHYAYGPGEEPVLRGIDFELLPGECVGIVGMTGSGKSTLLDVLVGLAEPTQGSVEVDGTPLARCRTAWQRRIGYVPQEVFLLDDSVRQNVALGLAAVDVDEALLRDAVRRAQLEDVVASLPDGLGTRIGERGARLSGGEAQRVGVARALYAQPAALVLDEATSSLDAVTERALLAAIRCSPQRPAILLVSHRVSALRECDRLLLMEGGRIEAEGGFEELMQRSLRFRELAATTPQGTM